MINFLKNIFSHIFKNSSTSRVKNFEDTIKSLIDGRERFYKDTEFIKSRLAEVFDLYFSATDLVKKVASKDDEERLIPEILSISFRRILSSFFLLESGFAQEARMLLRNFLEYLLITIDITYNSERLIEWGKTEHDNLDDKLDTWSFRASEVKKRIESDITGMYPTEEKANAINAYSEWIKISNQILHAHSRAQTKNIVKQSNFELFGWYSLDDYKKIFNVYRELLLALIQEIIFIPKYRKKILQSKELASLAEIVADKFSKYQKIIACEKEILEKQNGATSNELNSILKKYQINIDISSISNNAVIDSIEITILNGEYILSVAYRE